jgi:hypothetical protein
VAHRLDLADTDYICDDERVRNRHAKAYKLFKAGINLKMSIELHKSPSLIPPYLHKERTPITECLYDASVVGFHRHIINEVTDENLQTSLEPTGDAPETDQLGDADISMLRGKMRRAMHLLKHKFVPPGRRLAFMDMFDSDDGSESLAGSDEEFEVDDLDEEDDMELDLELDNDGHFIDEDGNHVFEEDGELFVTVWETATEDEFDSDMDEEEDDDDDEMHDAVESQQQQQQQQPANNDVD